MFVSKCRISCELPAPLVFALRLRPPNAAAHGQRTVTWMRGFAERPPLNVNSLFRPSPCTMSVASPIRWLLTAPNPPGVGRAIVWWEKHRIPVNLLIFVYGVVCLVLFFAAINGSHVLQPGEDAVEPIAILLAPIAFNICYTFGWLVEVSARAVAPGLTPKLGPRLLLAGLSFSFCIISLSAVFWGGYFILHAIGVVK